MNGFEFLFAMLVLVLVLIVAFLPAIVASRRRHRNRAAILVCTIIGWFTVVAWLIALVWSFTNNVEERS